VTAAQATEPQRPLENGVVVANAWIRQTDAQAKANVGYLTLVNRSDRPTTLVAVDSDEFDSVEMHEMTMVDGLLEMRELSELALPAGAEVQFEPGGKHLMLNALHRHLQSGESVQLELRFASGLRQKIRAEVADR
jgi:periplasmic copper chaperone A